MSQAKKIKEFYNQNFFKQGKAKEAHVILTFKINDKEVTIPGIKVLPDATIDGIFKAYHNYLSQNPIEISKEQGAKKEKKGSNVLDFEQLEYNNHIYLLEQNGEDEFTIRNKESGKMLSPKSPVFKAIVKQFKE